MIGEFGLAQTFVSSIVFAVDVEESFGFCFHKAAVDHGIGSFDVGEGFFNVDDGLEDFTATMEQFGREHLIRGTVIALTVPFTSADLERNDSAEGSEPVDHIPVE